MAHPQQCIRSSDHLRSRLRIQPGRVPFGHRAWKSSFGAGNDYDINFVPDYKVLHDAGYNVLAFDFRNFGLSASANGGTQSDLPLRVS